MIDTIFYLVPKDNVATIDKSAIVQDGVSRSRHALLNGDTSNYDWDSGYTCHQLGSGSICVQLGQPYAIDSMKYVDSLLTIKNNFSLFNKFYQFGIFNRYSIVN